MDIIGGATRVIFRTADATTAAAGAIGGAAINGVVGGLQGTASGVRNGLGSGSHSTPAAALTLGVLGAAGLVDWPLLLAIGGTALVVHQISHRSDGHQATAPERSLGAVDGGITSRRATGGGSARKSAPRKASPRKASPRKPSATAARTRPRKTATSGRRTRSSS